MNKYVFLFLIFAGVMCSQEADAQKFHNAYYDTRIAAHELEGMQSNAIVFIGNSITEQGWWQILIPNKVIENRGIGGDNTYGMLDRLPTILQKSPRKIFLMAGINDLTAGYPIDDIMANISKMSDMIHAQCPDCRLYIQSVLPVNDERLAYPAIKGKNPEIVKLNGKLKELCEQTEWADFVNVAPMMTDTNGQLKLEYTKDGIHLHPAAYVAWVNYLKQQKLLK